MKRSFVKILAIVMIIGFIWTGFSAVIDTFAYMNDTETSTENSYSAGILDFSIPPAPDFSPDVTPASSSSRTISIINDGILGFQYTVQTSNATGTLCDFLNLTANRNGVDIGYSGTLKDFTYNIDEFLDPDDWIFTANLTSSDISLQNQTCAFDFVFNGWQTDFSDPSQGFSDEERIGNVILAGDWTPPVISNVSYLIGTPGESNELKAIITWETNESATSDVDWGIDTSYGNIAPIIEDTTADNISHSVEILGLIEDTIYHFRVRSKDAFGNEAISDDFIFETDGSRWGVVWSDIVINEFLIDPLGDDSAPMPDGEWVELYNKGESAITLTGWYLSDSNNNKLPVPTSSIPPKGFLVVYLNGQYADWLDNNTDIVALWKPSGYGYSLVDFHFYNKWLGDIVLENKSFARIPDGSNTWYDPIPTPGAPNKLSEEEKMELGLLPLEEQIATTTSTELPVEQPITTTTTIAPITSGGGSIDTTTTTEPPAEESDFTATTTTIPEETTTTTTIPEDTVTTTTTIPPIAEEASAEEPAVVDEPAVIEETPVDETSVIEQTPVTEEQPVIAPADNNSGEQALPADNSSSGGDSGGGDSGEGETVSAAPSDGATE